MKKSKPAIPGTEPPPQRRFQKLSDLWLLWQEAEKSRPVGTWDAIMKAWERLPLRDCEDGSPMPSFGTLHYKVRKQQSSYVDYATERNQWASIETHEGMEEGLSGQWSKIISDAFQRFCINLWDDRVSVIMLAVRDMLLFRNGVLHWEDESSVVPVSADVYHFCPCPDADAKPDKMDVVFIRKSFKAVELYDAAKHDESAERGWQRSSVTKLLNHLCSSGGRDPDADSIWTKFAEGKINQPSMDTRIDVVFALVSEYRDGQNNLSVYIFPAREGSYPTTRSDKNFSEAADRMGFLFWKPRAIECQSRRFAILSSSPARKYWEGKSFAELIYGVSKTYDIVMNRILQSVEDNMRVYLESASQEEFDKLRRMRHRQYNLLKPSIKIAQQQIKRPVQEAAQVLRTLILDQNDGIGSYSIGELSQTSQPKTAKQSEIDFNESLKVSSAELKMFNASNTPFMRELYRRFTTQEEPVNAPEDSQQMKLWDGFKRFKRFLKHHNVPDAAWKYRNVTVNSIMSLGSGSPSARLQSARLTMEALATPAASPGERLAQRDMIAAAQGIENVDAYIPRDADFAVPEDSLIGLENESLSDPGAKPTNIPVHAQHLHFRHIPSHIQDAVASLQAAQGLLQNLGQFPPSDHGVYLKTIQDISIGIDNKLSHAQAHVKAASRTTDKRKQATLKQFAFQIQQVNRQQDMLDKTLMQMMEARAAEQQPQQEPPEIQHKRTMNALIEEHEARMMAMDYQKAEAKGEQLRNNSAANTEHKQQLENLKTVESIKRDTMKAAADIRISAAKEAAKPAKPPPKPQK